MSILTDLPLRSNGDDIVAAWFNAIRTVLISIFGNVVGETLYDTFNNKSSYTDVTDLNVTSDVDQAAEVDYFIEREDDTPTHVLEKAAFILIFNSSTNTWQIIPGRSYGPDDAMGISAFPFQVVTSGAGPYVGQVQHKSSNMTGGSYSDSMKFKIRTFTP